MGNCGIVLLIPEMQRLIHSYPTNMLKKARYTKHDEYTPFQDYDATKQRSCIYLRLSVYYQERGFDTLATFARATCGSQTQKLVEPNRAKHEPTYPQSLKNQRKSFVGGR